MSTPFKPGCARPAPTLKKTVVEQESNKPQNTKESSMIKVGRAAPDFELAGYHQGEFKQFKLSEFKGKWVLLCFYPGDFTFV